MRVPIPTVDDPALVWRRVQVPAPQVVFVRGVLEASEGLACMFAERGGDLLLVSHRSRERELDEVVADFRSDFGAIVLSVGGTPGSPGPHDPNHGSAH